MHVEEKPLISIHTGRLPMGMVKQKEFVTRPLFPCRGIVVQRDGRIANDSRVMLGIEGKVVGLRLFVKVSC